MPLGRQTQEEPTQTVVVSAPFFAIDYAKFTLEQMKNTDMPEGKHIGIPKLSVFREQKAHI